MRNDGFGHDYEPGKFTNEAAEALAFEEKLKRQAAERDRKFGKIGAASSVNPSVQGENAEDAIESSKETKQKAIRERDERKRTEKEAISEARKVKEEVNRETRFLDKNKITLAEQKANGRVLNTEEGKKEMEMAKRKSEEIVARANDFSEADNTNDGGNSNSPRSWDDITKKKTQIEDWLEQDRKHQEELDERDNNWGHSIEEDDPIHGFSDDNDAANRFLLDEFDKREKEEARKKQNSHPEVEPLTPINEHADNNKGRNSRGSFTYDKNELTEQEKKLLTVHSEAMRERDRVKNPGPARYRLMSVAAVELERIEQPDDPSERTRIINEEIEKAARAAIDNKEEDKYHGDTVAAVQAYISEILIGEDADSVSIGTTETLMGEKGYIGRNQDASYKNLVVIRWTKNGINHVFSFSPRKDAAFYALVDDSMGSSWRRKHMMAGAINDVDRNNMIIVNHKVQHDGFHHEKSLENIVDRILSKELEIIQSSDYSVEDKAKAISAIGDSYKKLAHTNKRLFEEKITDEAREEEDRLLRYTIKKANEEQ